MWKAVQFATALVLVANYTYAQEVAQTPLPPIYPAPSTPVTAAPASVVAPIPPVSADFNSGFCAGWNAAVQVEAQRHANWRALVTATRTDEGAKTPVGQAADVLIGSVAVYLLVPAAQGALTLSDGRTVNCATTPEVKK